MHSTILIVFHAVIAQALATDPMDKLADNLVNKLMDRVTSEPFDLADLEQTTLAKPVAQTGTTSYGKVGASRLYQPVMIKPILSPPRLGSLASSSPQFHMNAMAMPSNYMQATRASPVSVQATAASESPPKKILRQVKQGTVISAGKMDKNYYCRNKAKGEKLKVPCVGEQVQEVPGA